MSTSEPFFVAQTGECKTPEDARAWFRARLAEAEAEGAAFTRYSRHSFIENLILIECWRHRPKEQGEPRFAIAARAEKPE